MRGLAGAIAIVEQVLGVGVVDGDDGITQHAFLGHGAQADDAGGGFFGAADHVRRVRVGALGVKDGDQVGAVVHGDLRLVVERGHDVAVVGVVVLALDGEDGDVVVADQAGGHVILRGKRVGRAEHDVGAAVAQGDHEIRGFGGYVQAGGDANALERLILDEFLADHLQDLHRLVGPLDAFLAQIGQFKSFNSLAN